MKYELGDKILCLETRGFEVTWSSFIIKKNKWYEIVMINEKERMGKKYAIHSDPDGYLIFFSKEQVQKYFRTIKQIRKEKLNELKWK